MRQCSVLPVLRHSHTLGTTATTGVQMRRPNYCRVIRSMSLQQVTSVQHIRDVVVRRTQDTGLHALSVKGMVICLLVSCIDAEWIPSGGKCSRHTLALP